MLFSFVKSAALSESLQSTVVKHQFCMCKYYLCTSLTLSNAFNATYKKCGKTEVEKWLALVWKKGRKIHFCWMCPVQCIHLSKGVNAAVG